VRPGDKVTLVHGLPPSGSQLVEVIKVRGPMVDVMTGGGPLAVQADFLVSGSTSSPTHRTTDMATAVNAGMAAAASLSKGQWLVLDALARADRAGLMDCEHEPLNGLRPDSSGKRRVELVRHRLVEDSGTRRESPRGRPAQVWRITALGREIWQREARRRAA
jgi:hypothetical protein